MVGDLGTLLTECRGAKKIQVALQLDNSRILRTIILDLSNNLWHQRPFSEYSFKWFAQVHSVLHFLQNR